ncbi:MAG: DUF1800 domain-containing protein [Pseudomonadota bacterium]
MNKKKSLIAINRFGYGPANQQKLILITRKGYKNWVLSELKSGEFYKTANTEEVYRTMPQGSLLKVKKDPSKSKKTIKAERAAKRNQRNAQSRKIFRRAQLDVHSNAVSNTSSVRSRAVNFWLNHFSVSTKNMMTRSLAGAFVKESISPHVAGNFSKMLISAVTHSAMLHYLDNHRSIGPNSKMGRRRKKDLNENLAREVLELHTLGVGNYSQKDIIELANILTGWTSNYATNGKSIFNERAHEPGDFIVLGKTYSGKYPKQQLLSVLKDLARHPKTAEHLSKKLSQHYLGGFTNAQHVNSLSQSYLRSGGDLYEMYKTLINFSEVWELPVVRYRQPDEWMYAMARSIPNFTDFQWINGKLKMLGKAPFQAPSPAGWPDKDESWRNPEILFRQKVIVQEMAARFVKQYEIKQVIDDVLGGEVDDHLKQALSLTNNKKEQFALIFLSPSILYR